MAHNGVDSISRLSEGVVVDGIFKIAVGKSRRSKSWKTQKMSWSKFLQLVANTKRTSERYIDFINMSKEKQDDIKDIGGFVGGELKDGRRIASNVINRQLIVLDADFAPNDFSREVMERINCACCVYSTHKHSKNNPRFRLVIPLDRAVNPDEYQAIARRIAEIIGIDYFDDTTYQPHRLMYWPSTSIDGEYVFEYQDSKWLVADDVLATYEDWTDQTSWPVSVRATNAVARSLKKQANPLEKGGIVGAFCKAYTIDAAIEKFLPDVYAPCAIEGRYTYTGGSSSAGAVVYDDMFLYSHHATDPCSMKLVNAFDLVRLHKFENLDEKARTTDATKLPSYAAMCKLASEDAGVKAEIVKEQLASADAFEDLPEDAEGEPNWTAKLDINEKSGAILPTRHNIELILKNDTKIKGTFGYEEFSQRIAIKQVPKWREGVDRSIYWDDTDDANLRLHLETNYHIDSRMKTDDCILTVASENRFHVIRDFLNKLEWDGVPRLNTVLIDFLGAEDSEYVRQVTRKTLIAAVARVYKPGTKFDTMMVLVGKQGIGKSYLLKKLGGEWFSDSITSFQGKDAYEQLRGVWIEEVSELSAMRKMDLEPVKQFITKQVDTYRPAYGRNLTDYPRQCIFVGTTNTTNFLRDKTGNRRFLPIVVGGDIITKSLFSEGVDDYMAQVWAEAKVAYDSGEELILEGAAAKAAVRAQEEHMEENPLEGAVAESLDKAVPGNWYQLDMRARRDFIRGAGFEIDTEGGFIRDKVCTLEIWCELLGGDIKNLDGHNRKEICETMNNLEGWVRSTKAMWFGQAYGTQKGWVREK